MSPEIVGLVISGALALLATLAELRRDRMLAERVAALEVEVRMLKDRGS